MVRGGTVFLAQRSSWMILVAEPSKITFLRAIVSSNVSPALVFENALPHCDILLRPCGISMCTCTGLCCVHTLTYVYAATLAHL